MTKPRARGRRRPRANDVLRQLTIGDLEDFEQRMAFGLDVPEMDLDQDLGRDVRRMTLESSSGVYAQRRSRW